jgi:hypothetical protein
MFRYWSGKDDDVITEPAAESAAGFLLSFSKRTALSLNSRVNGFLLFIEHPFLLYCILICILFEVSVKLG